MTLRVGNVVARMSLAKEEDRTPISDAAGTDRAAVIEARLPGAVADMRN